MSEAVVVLDNALFEIPEQYVINLQQSRGEKFRNSKGGEVSVL